MDLIYEKNSLLSIHAKGILRRLYYILHVFLTGYRGIDLGKFRTGRSGDNLGKSRLAGSRRSVKNNGAELVCLDRPVKQLVPTDDVLLSYDLVQCPWPQSCCQRSFPFHTRAPHIFK